MNKLKVKISEGRRYFAQSSLKPKKLVFVFKYLKVFFILLLFFFAVIFFINKYYLSFFVVSLDSMYPNLKKGDLILVLKNYKIINPGDIVVFKHKNKFLIKRVIALPGEKVSFDGTNIVSKNCIFKIFTHEYKNNYGILEEAIFCPKLKIKKSYRIIPTKVKPFEMVYNGYFLLGDNRVTSIDSRVFGGIKKENIFGKYLYKLR